MKNGRQVKSGLQVKNGRPSASLARASLAFDALIKIPILHSIMKYWNEKRIRKVRERREREEKASVARAVARMRKACTYTPGDTEKNSNLMLSALGLPLRRQMLMRLQKEGAVSLSKLGRPFGMKLPGLYRQMQILEQSGLITTHKRGRVRMCVFNRGAFHELSAWLVSHAR